MPETKISGTDRLRYGSLAGKYVPEEVYKDLISATKFYNTTGKGSGKYLKSASIKSCNTKLLTILLV